MKKPFFIFIFLFSSISFAMDFHCPEKIETTQSLSKQVAGWKAGTVSKAPQWYDRFQIYSGPPSEMASLIPEGPKGKEFWSYDHKYGLWIQCIYSGSSVTLEMEIPKNVKKCTAKVDTSKKSFLSCQ
jgi:hypothetical protein